mgnify:CR=1 FL=1
MYIKKILLNNKITDINLDGVCGLTTIECGGNLIEKLDVSKTAAFSTLASDQKLSLYQSDITMELTLTKEQSNILKNNINYPNARISVAVVADKYLDVSDNVTDDKFREYIFSTVDKNNDGKISEYEALLCEELNLNKRGISSLKGIELFSNLQVLNCASNDLEKVDLSNNKRLIILDINNNKLSSIDLSACKELEKLNINNNT